MPHSHNWLNLLNLIIQSTKQVVWRIQTFPGFNGNVAVSLRFWCDYFESGIYFSWSKLSWEFSVFSCESSRVVSMCCESKFAACRELTSVLIAYRRRVTIYEKFVNDKQTWQTLYTTVSPLPSKFRRTLRRRILEINNDFNWMLT